MLDKGKQDTLGIVQPAHALDRAEHVLWIHNEVFDHAGEAMECKIEMDGGVGADAALDGRMRDVTLVPQGDIFERRGHGRANEPGETGQVLCQDRIAFVRHCRRAFLAGREEFLGFEHFGALQMAHFRGKSLDGRCDHAEDREIHRMPVARDDLRGDRLDREAQPGRNVRFDGGIDIGEGSDGAGDGAGGDFFACQHKARAGALEFGVEGRQLDPRKSCPCAGSGLRRRHVLRHL